MNLEEFKSLVETQLSNAELANPNDAPFGFNAEECRAWMGGKATALAWVLDITRRYSIRLLLLSEYWRHEPRRTGV